MDQKFSQHQGLFKAIAAAVFFSLCASLPATAQQAQATNPAPAQSAPTAVVETFDGSDLSTVLGGQFRQTPNATQWIVYLAEGKLVLENRQNPNNLHFNDIAWVRYPDASVIEPTRNSVISAVVESTASSAGGVGILVGSGKSGAYLAFVVDNAGRYHLLQKDGRQLRTIFTETNAAILVDQPNELTFEVRGANIAFLVNGEDMIQIESPNQMPGSRRIDGRTGVGIAAFGIGTYYIDSLTISRGNS